MSVIVTTTFGNSLLYPNGLVKANWAKTRSVQRPYVDKRKPLAYQASWNHQTDMVTLGGSPGTGVDSSVYKCATRAPLFCIYPMSDSRTPSEVKETYNKAYARFKKRWTECSVDLIALVRERQEAKHMILTRATQLSKFMEAAIRRDTTGMAKQLGISKSAFRAQNVRHLRALKAKQPGIHELAGKPGSFMLELSWGWMPLVDDISTLLQGLGKGFTDLNIVGTAKYKHSFPSGGSGPGIWSQSLETGDLKVKIGARFVRKSALQEQVARLGLLNVPASIWELTAYSWLVDYFANVGDVIGSFDDSIELSYVDSFVTRFYTGGTDIRLLQSGYYGYNLKRRHVQVKREVGPLPGVFLQWQSDPFSWRRLALVTSLLAVKFQRVKRLKSTL